MKKLFLSAAFLAGGVLFCNAQVAKKENGEKPVAKADTLKSANPVKEEVKKLSNFQLGKPKRILPEKLQK